LRKYHDKTSKIEEYHKSNSDIKRLCTLVAIALILMAMLVPVNARSVVAAPTVVTRNYGDITFPAALATYTMPDFWDLNAGPVTVRYTLDLSGAPNVAKTGNYNQAGLVGLLSGGSGARMGGFLSDWGHASLEFPAYPYYPNNLTNHDKFNMQKFPYPGSWDEQMYDVNFATQPPTFGLPGFNPWANYGIWFDRDGVDQWQANMWGMVNGGTYNTAGIYDAQLTFSKFSPTKGTACPTFFPDQANQWDPTGKGIGTGFYTTWHAGAPDYYPTGISFDTDVTKMGSMRVVVQGSSGGGQIIVKNLKVTGILASFAVNASVSGGHGAVTPTTQTVNYGSSATINISPDIGYHIASITDNGNPAAIANPYVISNVTAIHTVMVTFAGPQSSKQDALNGLIALGATVTDKQDGNKLDEAIKHLTKSLTPSWWIDDAHLQVKEGEKVFNEEKDAVNQLRDLIKNKKSSIADTALQPFVDRIVEADRLLAVVAIADAAGGDPKDIAKANEELGKGSAEAALGKYDSAIEHYRNAWKFAQKSN